MKLSVTDRVVLDALWIRRWACTLLGGGAPPLSLTERVAASSLAAWRVALSTERCAVPLSGQSTFRALLPQLPATVREVFENFRLQELQRAMSVRGQLRQLAVAASREGWRIVVLKGGVAIADGVHLDVKDLDVLALPEEIDAIVRFIEGGGAAPTGRIPALDGRTRAHLVPRRAPHRAQIEVHYRVHGLGPADELISGAEPLSSEPGLWRLSPEKHVHHLVWHLIYQHPDRVATLRDAILISQALRGCTSTSIEAIRERVARLPHPASARTLLDFAEALSSGRPLRDPYTRTAAGNYLARARVLNSGKGLSRTRTRTVFELFLGRDHYVRWAGPFVWQMDAAADRAWLEDLARTSPNLVTAMRRTYWSGRVLLDLPGGWPFVRRATRLAERFQAESTG